MKNAFFREKNRFFDEKTFFFLLKMNKKGKAAQIKKDTVVRRAAQLAAKRAARGQSIGNRLKQEREEAGKKRAHQLRIEHDAEGGDQDGK